jgi:hypothetical protein
MREVIRGVVDVLRTAGIRRAERHTHDDDEAFVMPPEADETREDAAYAASETGDASSSGRSESEGGRGQQKARGDSAASTGSERVQQAEGANGRQSEADAKLLRGMDRMVTAAQDDVALTGQSAARLSEEALSLAQEDNGDPASDMQLERGPAPEERLSQSARDDLAKGSAGEDPEGEEAMRRLDLARQTAKSRADTRVSTERLATATTGVGQRIVAEETSEVNVAIGANAESEDEQLEVAADEAFDKAQGVREQAATPEQPGVNRLTAGVHAGNQVVSGPPPMGSVGTVVSESVGSATVTETLMEEILVAQRGPAGGDRIGDADTVIRISEGAAGALQVKVRRDGDDLSLRVRAEDLAMRHVMAESLPELKHELQKANLVEGDIEVREDGIEDQMQSDFEWDDNQSARRDPQRESGHEVETAYDAPIVGNQQSNTTTARRHDGELYVVA